ncbi:MAG: hypothetical protein AB1331_06440 [Bacillota bacterium]
MRALWERLDPNLQEWLEAFWLFLLLYAVLTWADFGSGFQYVGF